MTINNYFIRSYSCRGAGITGDVIASPNSMSVTYIRVHSATFKDNVQVSFDGTNYQPFPNTYEIQAPKPFGVYYIKNTNAADNVIQIIESDGQVVNRALVFDSSSGKIATDIYGTDGVLSLQIATDAGGRIAGFNPDTSMSSAIPLVNNGPRVALEVASCDGSEGVVARGGTAPGSDLTGFRVNPLINGGVRFDATTRIATYASYVIPNLAAISTSPNHAGSALVSSAKTISGFGNTPNAAPYNSFNFWLADRIGNRAVSLCPVVDPEIVRQSRLQVSQPFGSPAYPGSYQLLRAGRSLIYGYSLKSFSASVDIEFRLVDSATTPPTTAVPIVSDAVPRVTISSPFFSGNKGPIMFSHPIAFDSGVYVAFTTSPASNTLGVAAGEPFVLTLFTNPVGI